MCCLSSGDAGLPPTTGIASRDVVENTAAVDQSVDRMRGNCQHGQRGLCVRGWHECSSRACRTGAYLWQGDGGGRRRRGSRQSGGTSAPQRHAGTRRGSLSCLFEADLYCVPAWAGPPISYGLGVPGTDVALCGILHTRDNDANFNGEDRDATP